MDDAFTGLGSYDQLVHAGCIDLELYFLGGFVALKPDQALYRSGNIDSLFHILLKLIFICITLISSTESRQDRLGFQSAKFKFILMDLCKNSII